MNKYVLAILLFVAGFSIKSNAQSVTLFGATSPSNYSKTGGQLWLVAHTATDSNKVLGVDSVGKVVLRTKVAPANYLQKSDTVRKVKVATYYYVDSLVNTVPTKARLLSDTAFGKYIYLKIDTSIIYDQWGALTIEGKIKKLPMGLANGHTIVTGVNFARDSGSYASISTFDTVTSRGGDHSVAFQDITKIIDSSTSNWRASFFAATTLRNTASLKEYRGLYIEGVTRADMSTNLDAQYGIKIKNLDAADTNWAIYTMGTTPSYFGGNITINRTKITNSTDSVLSTNTTGEIIPVNLATTYLKSATATSTYVPKTLTITINGVTQDLSANRTFTVTSGTTFSSDLSVNGLTIGRGPGNVAGNTALGSAALFSNTTGSNNIGIGDVGGGLITTGSNNIGLGFRSLGSSGGRAVTGNNNIGIGNQAAANVGTGGTNIGIGASAIGNTATGLNNNIGIGGSAGANITGGNNIAIGSNAIVNATGTENVAIGGSVGASGTPNTSNVLIGAAAGFAITTSNNTMVGDFAGGSVTSGANNTYLGRFRGTGFETSSNQIFLSDGSQNVRMRFNGAFGMIGSTTDDGSNRELQITGQLGVTDTVVAPRMRETAITSSLVGTTSDGTHYAATLSASATLDFPNTSNGSESDLTITVTGAADGDVVALGVPSASATEGSYHAFVSSANTVTVRFVNHKGSSVNPASGTFKVLVFK